MSSSSGMPRLTYYPADILEAIAAAVYAAALPSKATSLDPLYSLGRSDDAAPPTASPSTYPIAYWPEPTSRKTLATLCLVSKDFREAARPWLWRRLEINIPHHWLKILDAICGEDERPEGPRPPNNISGLLADSSVEYSHPRAISGAACSSEFECISASSSAAVGTTSEAGFDGTAAFPSGLGSVPHDLLTPPLSRAPSPARLHLRAASPGRWQFIKAVNRIVHHSEPGLYVPTPDDPSPGRHVRHLDFNYFRTMGLRRSSGDGTNAPFVTDVRLERVLKEMPNLRAFGANEFMESAISAGVLTELIVRGYPIAPENRCLVRRSRDEQQPRAAWFTESDSDEDSDDSEADGMARRAAAKPLEALDFCGCVGPIFVTALQTFVRNEGLLPPSLDGKLPRRVFSGLRRLGLRGVTSVPPNILSALVLSFPRLTHLDLTGTRCTPAVLESLSTHASNTVSDPGMRLKSLALGRCMGLTSAALARFIIGPTYDGVISMDDARGSLPSCPRGGVCAELEELSLYGDKSFPTLLTEEDLYLIVSSAPCFTSNAANMTYLDLSSCPVTARVLDRAFTNAGGARSLRSLGLSHIPSLGLSPLIEFITSRAPNVEILTLVNSCISELSMTPFSGNGRVNEAALALAVRSQLLDPICFLPFRNRSPHKNVPIDEGPTRLRVVEFSNALLNLLPPGPQPSNLSPSSTDVSACSSSSSAWTTIRSRGGRAWYVDASACWVNGRFVRGSTSPNPLPEVRPVQEEITMLSALGAGGHARHGSVGWHAHKMEILHGLGMLGREGGLYGAVSFAYTSG